MVVTSELPLLHKDKQKTHQPVFTSAAVASSSTFSAVHEAIREDRFRIRSIGTVLGWIAVGSGLATALITAQSVPVHQQRSVVDLTHGDLLRHAVQQEIGLLAESCGELANVTESDAPKPKESTWFLKGPDPTLILTEIPKATSIDELPAHWDWRDFNGTGIGLTTSVMNQMVPRACGSCWAFATVSALSDRIRIAQYRKTKKLGTEIVISPQVLLDCGMRTFGSCSGGDPRYAHKWIHENGIVDLTCSPYIASHPSWFSSPENCAATQCHTCDLTGQCAVVESPKKYYISEYGTLNATTLEEFELEAMNEIYHRGPIVVSMWSRAPEYKSYKGGYVLRDSTKYVGTTHVVNLIGWGTDENGVKYWIVRNSDGTNWGDQGFFMVERGVNTYNIETHGAWAVPIVE